MLKLALAAGLLGLFGAPALASAPLPQPVIASALTDISNNVCKNDPSLPGCGSSTQKLDAKGNASETLISQLVNTFLIAAGTISVIFVIMGGVRYITSTGDSARIKAAKDTMLYAIIGLIVTILAVPLSGFVIKAVAGG